MASRRISMIVWVGCTLLASPWLAETPGQSKVTLESVNGKHRLLRNGEPYFIKGVGGTTYLAQLAAAGGNSIRTWDTDNLAEILDEAHQHKLTVCVGLWLGHQRHGFDYQDQISVVRQLETCRKAVRKYMHHPALLMWGVGNEMEGNGDNPAIWYVVDHIARECKRLDPNHPTMTVIAELGKNKVQNIERFCPHVDIIGVNSYGGLLTVGERYRKKDSNKPYVVTELGPHGPWEVRKTGWGSAIEKSSSEKSKHYAAGYRKAVTAQPSLCLGSYAFLWGHKQETTLTWFGMLLPDGSRLPAVDVMTEAWTGRPPENRCPKIESLTASKTTKLQPGETIKARLSASDPESDPLKIQWVLRYDLGIIGLGGNTQEEEPSFANAVSGTGVESVVKMPDSGGGYRLFAYAFDGQGGAAVANLPIHVDGPIVPIPAVKAKLPFTIYADGVQASTYRPTGYMGNTKAITMKMNSTDNPRSGKTCLRVEYRAPGDWGGVLWQSPANDWEGKRPGGLNLTGASELEFWVRGAEGGETVNFVLGVIEGDVPYRDSAKGELNNVRLSKQWQKLRIPLDGRNLSRIKTGFGWSLPGRGKPVVFYLDDIRYVSP